MRIIKRLVSSLGIFVPFGCYVFAIQTAYDNTQIRAQPLSKAGLFLLALVAGSVTYDFAKHALFMQDKAFDQFFAKLIETSLALIFLAIFSIASALLLHFRDIFPLWLGVIVYCCALVTTGWLVMATTGAIEAATKRR